MQFHEVAHYGQTQAKTTMLPGGCAVGLAEAIEDMRQKHRADALAIVGDGDSGFLAGTIETDLYIAEPGSKLDCVYQQVPYDLLKAIGISEDRPNDWVKRCLDRH